MKNIAIVGFVFGKFNLKKKAKSNEITSSNNAAKFIYWLVYFQNNWEQTHDVHVIKCDRNSRAKLRHCATVQAILNGYDTQPNAVWLQSKNANWKFLLRCHTEASKSK